LNRNDTIAYVLYLVGDMIADHEERISLFIQAQPYKALTNLLNSSDDYIRLKAAALLSIFLSSDPSPPSSSISSLYNGLIKLLKLSSPEEDWDLEVHGVVLQGFAAVFRKPQGRSEVWKREQAEVSASEPKVIPALITILKSTVLGMQAPSNAGTPSGPASRSGANTPVNNFSTAGSGLSQPPPQLQYHIGLAFWILTYGKEISEGINGAYPQLIPLLTELARNAVKEKVVRIVLATFRNLATLAPKQTLPAMLSAKVLVFLKQVASSRKWSDEEVKEDVEFLRGELENIKKGLTTFDEYEQEVESGLLTWSTPTHQDDEFWKENAKKLEDKDKKTLKALVDILKTNKDPTALAIALNDLGQYMKFVDSGRKTVTDLGAKVLIMQLMRHENEDVKFKALVTVQRLVSHSWAS